MHASLQTTKRLRQLKRIAAATVLQSTFRQYNAKLLLQWKQLIHHYKQNDLPIRFQNLQKLQRWWHRE